MEDYITDAPADVPVRPAPVRGLVVVLALLALWGGWFIHRTSFVSNEGKHFYCLFDDAMISMTYARNLVDGYGLNWAKTGAPVEGFTHPLWTFLMIPVNALPLPLESRSLVVQLLSLVLLGANVVAVRRLVQARFATEGGSTGLPAAVLTAFCYPLCYWALLGMETGFQALLVTLAVHLALGVDEEGRGRHVALWLICAAAYLLRMDMMLMVVTVQLWVLAKGGVRRVLARRGWWLGLGLFLAAALGYSLFRWIYFHDVLPNTYYLKLTGVALTVRVLRGLWVLMPFLRDFLPLILPVAVLAVPLMRKKPRLILPAALCLIYCAYSVYVGGDAWEDLNTRSNRYIAFVLPLFFVIFDAVLDEALAAWSRRRGFARRSLTARCGAAMATALAFLIVNGLIFSPKQEDNWQNLLVTTRPPAVDGHRAVMDQLHTLQHGVDPDAMVASMWAGIPAYFTGYRMVDILGYNDRQIAHLESQVDLNEDNFQLFRPGHVKWSLGMALRKRPDAFFQIYAAANEKQLGRRMAQAGYVRLGGFWLRKDSPHIHWPEGTAPPPRPGGKGRK